MDLKANPAEDEPTSWLWAGLWLLFTYVSIPLARSVQEYVRSLGLAMGFLWVTIAAAGIAAMFIVREVRTGRLMLDRNRSLFLLAVGGLFCWLAWMLRGNPEEAFHFVQYGVFGLLLFRALRHRIRDASIFLLAFAIGIIAGTVDELIQWITPRRFFDFRDIGINALAGLLVQSAIGFGIRPPEIRPVFQTGGLRLACLAGMIGSLLFLFITGHTPEVWDAYKDKIPFSRHMNEVLAEYGYRIEDPEIGVFHSRLTPDELVRTDAETGRQVAAVLDEHRTGKSYSLLLERNPVYQAPYLVEARMHIFRRDRLYDESKSPKDKSADVRTLLTRAWFENRILEKYFPVALHNSIYLWPADLRARIEARIDQDFTFKSDVAGHLITRISQPLAMAIPAGFFVALFLAERMLARRSRA